MAIQCKEFRGALSPDYKVTQVRALEELNAWRQDNPEVQIISIETMASDHPSTMTSVGGYEYRGIRVWFEL